MGRVNPERLGETPERMHESAIPRTTVVGVTGDNRRVLGKRLLAVAALVIIGVVSSLIYSLRTSVYQANVTMVVSTPNPEPGTSALLRTIAQLAKSDRVLAEAISNAHVKIQPAELAPEVGVTLVPEAPETVLTVRNSSSENARKLVNSIANAVVEELSQWPKNQAAGDSTSPRIYVTSAYDSFRVQPNPARDIPLGGAVGLLAGLTILALRPRRTEQHQ